jgi:class 3 adenylate cyclase
MQRVSQQYNVSRAPEDQVLLCLGIGYGDMLRIAEDDVFGAEVNAASKLGEDTAKAGEILVTGQCATRRSCLKGARWCRSTMCRRARRRPTS